MMRTCLILCSLLLCASLHLSSQQLPFKIYTVQDGLVANSIRNIFQDSKGFIWIATWEGLSKYDGHKFTNFSMANGLSHNLINDLYEDKDGKIYVAENDGSIDIIQHDRVLKNPSSNKIVVNRFFPVNGQKVYAGTDSKGMLELREGKLHALPMQIQQSITGYIPLNDSLFVVSSENDFRIYDLQLNLFAELSGLYSDYNKVYRDSKNRVWTCSYGGLKLIAPGQKRNKPINFLPLPSPFNSPMFSEQPIYNMLEDNDGNFWFSTIKGLIKIDPTGQFRLLTTGFGLPATLIPCIFQDREKNIWLGSTQGLVKLVRRNDVQVFTTVHGLSNDEIFDIVPYKKNYLALGIGASGQKINTSDLSLEDLDEDAETLVSFARKQRSFGYLSLRSINNSLGGQFFCAASDDRGNLFLGTGGGIVLNSGPPRKDIAVTDRITTLVFDKQGYLWAGTWRNGLYRITPDYQPGEIHFTTEDFSTLLPDKNIRSGFLDSKGNLWFGTRYRGAIKLTGDSNSGYAFLYFNNSDNLISNWVTAFAEDKAGNIWIGTYSGLNKLKPSARGYQVFNFSRINNLFRSINTIYIDPEGILWCGGYPGLIRFRDDQLDTISASRVFITSIHAGKPEDSLYFSDIQQQLSLAHDHNLIQFEFSSPSFINEQEILYSYRLAGSSDTSWSNPSNQHFVLFASLQPGDYRFDVRAQGWNGEWGTATTYSFIIRPPFWKTWWFICICILFLGFLLFLLYRYRINQLIKLQQVRNRIATDLHDDIGSTLTNISILSELSNKNLQQPQEAKKFLQRITEEVNVSGQALDDIIWSVNSTNDTLEETLARMRRYAAELFDNSQTNYELQFSSEFNGKKMNMEQRRDLYLVYKESLNNIYKHAAAKNVWVQAGLKNHNLEMTIKDDGKGFNTDQLSHRNGLKNLSSRINKWKGKLTIHSTPGNGTRIYVSLPLHNR